MKANKIKFLLVIAAYFFIIAENQGADGKNENVIRSGITNPATSNQIPCLSKEGHMWLYRTNNPISVKKITGEDVSIFKTPLNEGNEIIVITNTGDGCSQQLESDRFSIKRGEQLIANYNITVEYGEIFLGFLDTTKNGWIDKTHPWNILKEGEHNNTYKTYVESEDTEASLAIRFHHTQPKQSKFKIKNIEIKKIEQRF